MAQEKQGNRDECAELIAADIWKCCAWGSGEASIETNSRRAGIFGGRNLSATTTQ